MRQLNTDFNTITPLKDKKIKWSKLTLEQKAAVVRVYNYQSQEGGQVSVIVSGGDTSLQERIDNVVPFNLDMVEYDYGRRLVIVPEYAGRSPRTVQELEEMEARCLPIIMPQGVIIDFTEQYGEVDE